MYVGGENYGLVQETVETENKRLSRKLIKIMDMQFQFFIYRYESYRAPPRLYR